MAKGVFFHIIIIIEPRWYRHAEGTERPPETCCIANSTSLTVCALGSSLLRSQRPQVVVTWNCPNTTAFSSPPLTLHPSFLFPLFLHASGLSKSSAASHSPISHNVTVFNQDVDISICLPWPLMPLQKVTRVLIMNYRFITSSLSCSPIQEVLHVLRNYGLYCIDTGFTSLPQPPVLAHSLPTRSANNCHMDNMRLPGVARLSSPNSPK